MLNDIPDAPWIGICKEEWEERCKIYDEENNQEEEEPE